MAINIANRLLGIGRTIRDIGTPKKPSTSELGYTRKSIIEGYLNEERRVDSLKIKDYIAMQGNDGEVQALMRLLALPIISAGFDIVVPEGVKEADSKEELDFIKKNLLSPPHLGGMTTPLQLIISDMTRAFAEGFRLYEKVWEFRDGKYWLRKLAPRDANTVKLKSDGHGGFSGAVQKVQFKMDFKEVLFPSYKCLLYTHQKEKDWLYGQSSLKAAYYHYDKKHKLYYIANKAAEVDTIPPRVLKLLENVEPDEKAKAEKAVDRIGLNTRVTLTKKFELEFIQPKGQPRVRVTDLIDHHNNQMAKSVLAQFIDLGAERKSTGSYAKAKEDVKLFTMGLQSEMAIMESHINWYVIPQLIDWNFGTGIYPEFKFNRLEDRVQDLLNKTFAALIQYGNKAALSAGFITEIVNKVGQQLNIDWIETPLDKDTSEEALADKVTTIKKRDKKKAVLLQLPGIKEVADKAESVWVRALTPAEEKVNFAEIVKRISEAEASVRSLVQGLFVSARADLMDKIEKLIDAGDIEAIIQLELEGVISGYASLLEGHMETLYEYSKVGVASELKTRPPITPKKELSLIKSKARTIAEKEVRDILFVSSIVAIEGIRNPVQTTRETIYLIGRAFDGAVSMNIPHTASITTSEAINMGRNVVFQQEIDRERIYAFQYSAIMDDRTCNYCQTLDKMVVSPTDPAYHRYMPPQHSNCRCIWVAIMQEEVNKPLVTGAPEVKPKEAVNKYPRLSDIIDTHKGMTSQEISYWFQFLVQAKDIADKENPSEKDLEELYEMRSKAPAGLRYLFDTPISVVRTRLDLI